MSVQPNLDMAQVYTDFSGLSALKNKAREDREGSLNEVARQFESLFVQMMLKSMRAASLGGGLLDSKQSEFYRDMYDQQLSVDMAGAGGVGLADVIARQLGNAADTAVSGGRGLDDYRAAPLPRVAPFTRAAPASVDDDPIAAAAADAVGGPIPAAPTEFIEALWPHAQAAAAELNLPPEALLAQAALETGWGRHVMPRSDGASSHNLFGIKADQRWDGERVRTNTREYRAGVALNTRADFRAYDSYAESFRDYVGFVKNNPRYAEALQVADDPQAYFAELQKAGYATDPAYAEKIVRILDGADMRAVRNARGDGGTRAI